MIGFMCPKCQAHPEFTQHLLRPCKYKRIRASTSPAGRENTHHLLGRNLGRKQNQQQQNEKEGDRNRTDGLTVLTNEDILEGNREDITHGKAPLKMSPVSLSNHLRPRSEKKREGAVA